MTTMSASWLSRSLSAIALTLPVAVWASDSLYSVYKVKGKSMEPSLMDGDVVLVRRVDFLPIILPYIHTQQELTTRARLLRAEGNGEQALLLSRPPLVLPGDVVVFANPSRAFPSEPNIKRVVAVAGQVMRPQNRFRSLETIPRFNIWVEGDNMEKSEDSNTFGPVSKKLLMGQAERVVWPPSRWQRIERVPPSEGRAWWM
jgi:signal peptidase I